MLTAADPIPIMALVNCETGRLTWKYGAPALDAMSRMYDTLWHKRERDAANRMWDKVRNMTVEQMAGQGMGMTRCGWRPEAHLPEVYHGTDVGVISSRPRPPKRS